MQIEWEGGREKGRRVRKERRKEKREVRKEGEREGGKRKSALEIIFLKLKFFLFLTLFSVYEKHLKNKTDFLGGTEKTTLVLISLSMYCSIFGL